jgi:hypothetical protein
MYNYLILYIECFENIQYAKYIKDWRYIEYDTIMARQRDDQKITRNIVLKVETYERLDKYKAKLIGERRTSAITYDDAIKELLENIGVENGDDS